VPLEAPPSLPVVVREWGRIGCTGFGGPPAHITLLRRLCVERRGWLAADEFEDAIAVCNLLPGPASTQLAIYCAWRLRGRAGALAGGCAFVLPGLALILGLSALFLARSPPLWVKGAAAGAGAGVAAVALQAGLLLVPASLGRTRSRTRWLLYAAVGAAGGAAAGQWLVLILLCSGLAEIAVRRSGPPAVGALLSAAAAAAPAGGLAALSWTAVKAGALSYGGGFVIVPLMQSDAVDRRHWLTGAQFLNAVALGQVTPGPVLHTVAVVGYAASGLSGALLAATVAFAPSFAFVLAGAPSFGALRASSHARAFLDGAGPAAVGAILGSAAPLAAALGAGWQYLFLAAAAVALLLLRRGSVLTLVCLGAAGSLLAAVHAVRLS
jgi:chromate transporter